MRASWKKLRRLVWERDKGVCQVCGLEMLHPTGGYHCGHIVDRVIGGADTMGNLLVMCGTCNQLKPVHSTHEEFDEWVASDYWLPDVVRAYNEKRDGFESIDVAMLRRLWCGK